MVILKTGEVSFSRVNNEAKKTRTGRVAMNDASFFKRRYNVITAADQFDHSN